jgi:hypothetical protein
MLFGKTAAELPHPTKFGQLLYLRRYNFNTWEGKFQAKKHHISLESDKFTHLISPVRELRAFGRNYLATHSLARTVNVSTKDIDLILKVKDSIGKDYTFTNGVSDYHMQL